MSKKLKSSDIARPFSSVVLAEARKVARRYHVVIEETDGLFLGSGLEMPLVMADGQTPEECLKNTRAALVADHSVRELLDAGWRYSCGAA